MQILVPTVQEVKNTAPNAIKFVIFHLHKYVFTIELSQLIYYVF